MRMPDWGPFGDTLFDAKLFAIAGALFLKSPGGGKVETVLTVATQRLPDRLLPRADFAAGISLYQSGLSLGRIAADTCHCNTLMIVREAIHRGKTLRIELVGFLENGSDEIDEPELIR